MADVLIIGYGPAGISAALYALRSNKSVVLVGKDAGALGKAHLIENYYGLEQSLTGNELFEIGKKQALALGATIEDDEIVDLFFDGKEFIAKGLKNEFLGRTCIMATGAARKSAGINKLQEMEGHGVSYCAVCDAFFYREKNIAVLGNSEYALHEIEELLPVVNSITLLTNNKEISAKFPEQVHIETRKIKSLIGENHFEGITFETGESATYDGLFVALGSASALDLAKKAGAAFEKNQIVLNKDFETTLPGLFVAGDATGGTLQIAVAVGEGAIAGMSAIKYLRQLE